jgi:hypothetical protein
MSFSWELLLSIPLFEIDPTLWHFNKIMADDLQFYPMLSGSFLTFFNARVIVNNEFRRIFKEAVMTYLVALLCSIFLHPYFLAGVFHHQRMRANLCYELTLSAERTFVGWLLVRLEVPLLLQDKFNWNFSLTSHNSGFLTSYYDELLYSQYVALHL